MAKKEISYIVSGGNYTAFGSSLDEAAQTYEEESGEPPSIDDCNWYKAEKIRVAIKEITSESIIED